MNGNRRIYLVEDDEEISDIIVKYLEKDGYEVTPFFRGDTAMAAIHEDPPDLAILDIMLPGLDGIEILKDIRKAGNLPVIVISARNDDIDRILGIELGADDYLPKPFSFRELVARVRSVFRSYERSREGGAERMASILSSRTLRLDLDTRVLTSEHSSTELTASEFSILKAMMSHRGRTLTRDEIRHRLAESSNSFNTRALDMHINNLRKKLIRLEVVPDSIQSVRGVGYRFED